jgi:hypothetical protein
MAHRASSRHPSFLGARRGAHSDRWPGTHTSASRLPSADRQRASAPAPPDPAGRSQSGSPAPAPAARPLTPNGSTGCRRRGCRLASTTSRSCTQRAAEAPEFAADRSLSRRFRLRCSRAVEPGLLRAQRARGTAAPHAAAPSRPLQPGGQRSHRTTEDRGSQQSAERSTHPAVWPQARPRRCSAAAGRSAGSGTQSAACVACRLGCRLCRARSLVIPF